MARKKYVEATEKVFGVVVTIRDGHYVAEEYGLNEYQTYLKKQELDMGLCNYTKKGHDISQIEEKAKKLFPGQRIFFDAYFFRR